MPEGHEVGSMYAKLSLDIGDFIAKCEEAKLAAEETGKVISRNLSTGTGSNAVDRNTRAMSNWQKAILAVATASAIMFTLWLESGPVLAGVTSVVSALLMPFTSLAAVIVGLLGPLSAFLTLAGVLGGLGGLGWFAALTDMGKKFPVIAGMLKYIDSLFHGLAITLGQSFAPTIRVALGWLEKFLIYGQQLAKMSEKGAIFSISTKGMGMLEHFNTWLYDALGRPMMILWDAVFGKAGNRISDAWSSILGKWAPLVQKMWGVFESWFDKQHFMEIGQRWANTLAQTVIPAILHATWTTILGIFGTDKLAGLMIPFGVAMGLLFFRGFRGVIWNGLKTLFTAGFGAILGGESSLLAKLGLGGAAAATGGAGAGAAAGADAGALAGIGAAAVPLVAVGAALAGIAYWLSTIPTPASASDKAFKHLHDAMSRIPGMAYYVKRSMDTATQAFKAMAAAEKAGNSAAALRDWNRGEQAQFNYSAAAYKLKQQVEGLMGSAQKAMKTFQPFTHTLMVHGQIIGQVSQGYAQGLIPKLLAAAQQAQNTTNKLRAMNSPWAEYTARVARYLRAVALLTSELNHLPTRKQIDINLVETYTAVVRGGAYKGKPLPPTQYNPLAGHGGHPQQGPMQGGAQEEHIHLILDGREVAHVVRNVFTGWQRQGQKLGFTGG